MWIDCFITWVFITIMFEREEFWLCIVLHCDLCFLISLPQAMSVVLGMGCANCVPRNWCQHIAYVGLGIEKCYAPQWRNVECHLEWHVHRNEKQIGSWKEEVIGITLKPETSKSPSLSLHICTDCNTISGLLPRKIKSLYRSVIRRKNLGKSKRRRKIERQSETHYKGVLSQ